MDVNNYISNFKSKICEITSEEYLETLNKNLEILDIKDTNFKTKLDINKKILYLNTRKSSDVYYALLNLASYDMESINFKKGFSNTINNELIGFGFNDVITDYFYNILFSVDSNISIGEIISLFIGNKKLLELYLKADLGELINNLNKYIEVTSILKIITTFDNINIKNRNNDFNDIIEIFINAYANKIRKNFDTSELDRFVEIFISITDLSEIDILQKINNYMYFNEIRLNKKSML